MTQTAVILPFRRPEPRKPEPPKAEPPEPAGGIDALWPPPDTLAPCDTEPP